MLLAVVAGLAAVAVVAVVAAAMAVVSAVVVAIVVVVVVAGVAVVEVGLSTKVPPAAVRHKFIAQPVRKRTPERHATGYIHGSTSS
jgi:hypothetical protein